MAQDKANSWWWTPAHRTPTDIAALAKALDAQADMCGIARAVILGFVLGTLGAMTPELALGGIGLILGVAAGLVLGKEKALALRLQAAEARDRLSSPTSDGSGKQD